MEFGLNLSTTARSIDRRLLSYSCPQFRLLELRFPCTRDSTWSRSLEAFGMTGCSVNTMGSSVKKKRRNKLSKVCNILIFKINKFSPQKASWRKCHGVTLAEKFHSKKISTPVKVKFIAKIFILDFRFLHHRNEKVSRHLVRDARQTFLNYSNFTGVFLVITHRG